VVYFFLLTGAYPFSGIPCDHSEANIGELKEQINKSRLYLPRLLDLHPDTVLFLKGCLKYYASDRFSSEDLPHCDYFSVQPTFTEPAPEALKEYLKNPFAFVEEARRHKQRSGKTHREFTHILINEM